MNFDEAISQLTDLKAHCQSYADELLRDENAEGALPWVDDAEALKIAINSIECGPLKFIEILDELEEIYEGHRPSPTVTGILLALGAVRIEVMNRFREV